MSGYHHNTKSRTNSVASPQSARPPTRKGRLSTANEESMVSQQQRQQQMRQQQQQMQQQMRQQQQQQQQQQMRQRQQLQQPVAAPEPPAIHINLPQGYDGPMPPPIEMIQDQLRQYMSEDHLQQLIAQQTQANGGKPLQYANPNQPTPPPQQQQQQTLYEHNTTPFKPVAGSPQDQQGPNQGLQSMQNIGYTAQRSGWGGGGGGVASSNVASLSIWGASAGGGGPGRSQGSTSAQEQQLSNQGTYTNFVPQAQSTAFLQQSGSAGAAGIKQASFGTSTRGDARSQVSRYNAGNII